jgi:hypothetical protein
VDRQLRAELRVWPLQLHPVRVNFYSPSHGHFRRLKLIYNYHRRHYVDVRVVKNRSYTFPGL